MRNNINIIENTKTTKALNAQKQIGQFGFPFTLNPIIGCPFGCKYCFSRLSLWRSPKDFFENIEVKVRMPEILDKELSNYSQLPQHLKRVQINEACDVYHPAVINYMKNKNKDLMSEILDIFHKHWNSGNKWMLHILTKSHLITNYLKKLNSMRQMVQIELSFASVYDAKIREIEMYTPSIKRRLQTVEDLSNADIFVRIMAMPFWGGTNELNMLKDLTFQRGANAFKNKGLNYFNWDDVSSSSFNDVLEQKLKRSGTKKDSYNPNFIIKSGEPLLNNGSIQYIYADLPKPKVRGIKQMDWSVMSEVSERLFSQQTPIIDCGYKDTNNVNWNYIK